MHTPKINIRNIAWAVLLLVVYALMFWGLEREEFLLYFSLFSVAFLFHLYPFSRWGSSSKPVLFIGAGIMIRLMAVTAFPILSEDLYRYIWDGYLTQLGISPYAYTPDECIKLFNSQEYPLIHSLYQFLNSPSYYSVYPPGAQIFFSFGGWLAASWGIPAAITGLKGLFLLVELGGWFFIYQLFQIQKMDKSWFWALWLNPLLIMEWNFNGHIESLAASFLLISVFMIKMKKNYLSAVLLGLAVLVKLWPLLFAPFFLKFIKTRVERNKWVSSFILTGAIGSIPLLINTEYILHFKSSLDLYLRTFEFNASIYYLFRAIGTWWYGYNPIHFIGPLCTIILLAICLWLYRTLKVFETRHLMDSILICGIVYLLFATTVHPWYLSLLLPFAYLNGRWSMVLWAYLIFASYHAYSFPRVEENFTMLVFTYSIVILTIMIDWKYFRKINA